MVIPLRALSPFAELRRQVPISLKEVRFLQYSNPLSQFPKILPNSVSIFLYLRPEFGLFIPSYTTIA